MNTFFKKGLSVVSLGLFSTLAFANNYQTIEAENFINTGGGYGGFHSYTTPSGIGAVNHVQTSDWGEYQVTINEAGLYSISAFVGTPMQGAAIQFSVPGDDTVIPVPTNGSWDTFSELEIWDEVYLPSGINIIRITAAGASSWEWNMDRFVISPVSQALDAVDDNASVESGQSVIIDVLENDIQPNEAAVISQYNNLIRAKHGSVSQVSDSELSYRADEGFVGVDRFTYTIEADYTLKTAWVSVTVTAQAKAYNDAATTISGHEVLIDVLANDHSRNDNELELVDVANTVRAKHGKVSIEEDKVLYRPDYGFSGEDIFSYTTDNGSNLDGALVTVTVNPSSIASPNVPVADEDGSFVISWNNNNESMFLQRRRVGGNWLDVDDSAPNEIAHTSQMSGLSDGNYEFRLYNPAPIDAKDNYSAVVGVSVSGLPAVKVKSKTASGFFNLTWETSYANTVLQRRSNGENWQMVSHVSIGSNEYKRSEYGLGNGLYEYRLLSMVNGEALTSSTRSISVGANKLRLLMVYPNKLLTLFGDESAVEGRLKTMLNYGQVALDNSLVGFDIEIIGMKSAELLGSQGDYSAKHSNLYLLRDSEYVKSLKEEYRPDLVAYIGTSHPDYCGIAYYPNDPKKYAVSYTSHSCTSTLIHEMGHNLGAGHGQTAEELSQGRIYPWSMGYGVVGRFRSIMAYSSYYQAPRIQYFSTPLVEQCAGDLACGVASEADAALGIERVFNETVSSYSSIW
ncbi:Ig-like domain-containing protein [Agaribacterium sp. ZY112]|uniref:Ig-like domain-containing protein n=1 Tax=Agaribacterium sp. ZY112 TaxID=3233574 RepID=UPI0035262E8A